MQRLKISGLPSLVNALIMTSILSAGNGLLYAAARTLREQGFAKVASLRGGLQAWRAENLPLVRSDAKGR